MGGNALKEFGAVRVTKDEYTKYRNEVLEKFRFLPDLWFIPHVLEKETFGDLDVVYDSKYSSHVYEEIANNNHAFVKNGGVISYLHDKKLQVDMIATKTDDIAYSVNYFSYNDLGNLVGRVAHKMGLKHGHDGLSLPVRDGNYHMGVISLTKDFGRAMNFLGYSYERFLNKFHTFEDMFNYVADNPRFSPRIYLLENRNHTARVRDKKRKTYTDFLSWCEKNRMRLNDYGWKEKSHYLEEIFNEFPKAREEYDTLMAARAAQVAVRQKYPMSNLNDLLGLYGKALGEFIQYIRAKYDVENMILAHEVEALDALFIAEYEEYMHDRT